VHTNPLQEMLNRLDYDILDYVETKRRGHDELLPQKARDIGRSVARLIEARFAEPEAAHAAFDRWQEESLYGYAESHLVNLGVHLIHSIDRHIEMCKPLPASTSLPEKPRPLAHAAGAH
jgi:post-segregation antitoxin (ccd killing protein)